jgi:hypothetical protein
LIKVALRPPVCVYSVAAACAKAALDESGDLPTVDGTEQINKYSGQPDSTGLTDALAWTKEKLGEFYDWAKVEVPKAVGVIQSKLDEGMIVVRARVHEWLKNIKKIDPIHCKICTMR